MSQPILSVGVWVSLPTEVRNKFRSLFGINKSGITEVDDNRIVSDGTTHTDLSVLTIPKLQEYTGDKSDDFYKLFYKAVEKINNELNPVTVLDDNPITVIIEPTSEVKETKKRGRPAKAHAAKE